MKRIGTTLSKILFGGRATDGPGETSPSKQPALVEDYMSAKCVDAKTSPTKKRKQTTSVPWLSQCQVLPGGTVIHAGCTFPPKGSKCSAGAAINSRQKKKTKQENRSEERENWRLQAKYEAKQALLSEEEAVSNQKHYTELAIQPMDYILANKLDWCAANVVKYVSRYKLKGGRKDLLKAQEYLKRLIKETP